MERCGRRNTRVRLYLHKCRVAETNVRKEKERRCGREGWLSKNNKKRQV
jgi:hypothetical protein